MSRVLVLLACFGGAVLGEGVKYLPQGLILTWSFPSETEVSFEYHIPDSVLEEYGWAGLGFKFPDEGKGMGNSDIINIFFEEDTIQDAWATGNSKPKEDTELGGTDDLQRSEPFSQEGFRVYSWTRLLDTGDQYDKELIIDQEYTLLWAFGEYKEGSQKKHIRSGRGSETIVLSEDYYDDTAATTSFLSFNN